MVAGPQAVSEHVRGVFDHVERLVQIAAFHMEPGLCHEVVLAWFSLFDLEPRAPFEQLRRRFDVVAAECNLAVQERRFELAPRVAHLGIDGRGAAGVQLGHVQVVGVDADHREQPLRPALAARRAERVERAERVHGPRLRALEVHQPVFNVR